MKTDDFDFHLPDELIAQFPLANRADSRMLYVNHTHPELRDTAFRNLPDYLNPGDVVVLNNTRVVKARLTGIKSTGGKVEVMIERILGTHQARALIRASHAPVTGSALLLENGITARVEAREQDIYTLHFIHTLPLTELLDQYGQTPLPPYIERSATLSDTSRYQTVFARESGAVAAPTAGLHFDEAMLEVLRAMGVHVTYITLHVGAGTFQPVRAENIEQHVMHTEQYHIPEETIEIIRQCRLAGGRVLAVGTTSLRTLEACAQLHDGRLVAGTNETGLFITPGYRFRIVDRLLTNFHLPRSTLLMLVSAFAGVETIRHAYRHAIDNRYRFFSYGDAMFIECNGR
ncbi:tRNA preQ1(34) S-adenosylmethionine ribosyltransferase-isomerase QueA [Nitrosomonas sp.]|uniref:tRNA preQ1(34) S-adenosylmethionine ribosyltransferase-isomerase QueA n=1 Tax=Nitrosomonas sp. TaxID=42353 RepID=UPI0025E00B4A|nr:tRNA preQ1(34) S-adenosylmethionine ribosyltransferase-isomerase QueA [Nitrosomonas sp.]MCC6915758.1 tRNA preQ1(34) S-adenosylmethionine ribosyltransferase-isomerase QueA [Nitrosomonas sp.]